ncbi:unnamed protein product [Blepharisma stoltei]|uniref:Uncharacterized protein n=1 Tax=Blepharisma stoltei TaxID=1481888 RepID=A0AAU9JX86_9CILI|nr:unnamed protein product [Blepharisma stoltei]
MASAEEYKIRALIETIKYFWNNRESDQTYPDQARATFDEADLLLRSNTRIIPQKFSLQLIVLFSEVGMLIENRNEVVERYLNIYFQYSGMQDQFYVRALLAFAEIQSFKIQTQSLKGQDAIDQAKLAFSFVLKAIEIVIRPENKPKYQFLVYNISVSAWKILRPMLLAGISKSFIDAFEKISSLLEEIDDQDTAWRIRFMQALANCYLDAERKPDASKMLDKIWDITKRKGPVSFQEVLWRMKVHVNKENSGTVGSLKKEAESNKSDLKFFVGLQQIRSGGLPDNQVEKELTAVLQNKPGSEALAELSRAALQYNLINMAKQCLDQLQNVRQPSLRARIWIEYSQAELLVKDNSEQIDKATGTKISLAKLKQQELDKRIEALKIVDRAMIANKRLNDPGVTTEGCVLIWNIGKPLLIGSGRAHVYKPFQTAVGYLEAMQSPLHELRINLHMELAKYELQEDFIAKAEGQIIKAYSLDATNFKLNAPTTEFEDQKSMQRPYERALYPLKKKLELKRDIYKDPERLFEQAWLDLENAKNLDSKGAKENLLRRAVQNLLTDEQVEIVMEPNLVEEEKNEKLRLKRYQDYKDLKLRYLISGEVAQLALKEKFYEIAWQASDFVVSREWDVNKEADLIATQASCHFVLAQCKSWRIQELGFEPGFAQSIPVGSLPSESLATNNQPEEAVELKRQIVMHTRNGVRLGIAISQSWICFNGAVYFYNIYIPVFRFSSFEKHIFNEALDCLRYLFETLASQLEKQALVNVPGVLVPFNKTVDFNYQSKLRIISEVAISLIKLLIHNNLHDESIKDCDTLLTKPIGPHYRKELEKLKGTSLASKGISQPKAPAKGQVAAESPTAEVLSLMESARAMKREPGKKSLCIEALKKANTVLTGWVPSENDENELVVHCEIWARLGRQSFELNDINKLALLCAQRSLNFKEKGTPCKKRLCWYSVSEFLYGEILIKLIDEKKQEKESQMALITSALTHFVESARIGLQTGINKLVLDAGRACFNTSLLIPGNEKKLICKYTGDYGNEALIQPLSKMAEFLVDLNDSSDPDFLLLFYQSLIEALTKAEQWNQGERIVEDAFQITPTSHQKWLWEAQMLFLSKQGKNVMNYLLRMKESEPLMQAKIWVKLARSSIQPNDIDNAYKKAADLLKGHVESSEILIEWSTWLHSRGFDVNDKLTNAADILLEIEKETFEDNASLSSYSSSRLSSKMSGKSLKSQSNLHQKTSRSKLTSHDEVEGNPDKLNITHYERLVRIYMMLAELAQNSHRRKHYLLQSFTWIKRILESVTGPMSRNKQEWLSYEIPEETLQELAKEETRDKFCSFAFDKPNLTHYFLRLMAYWLEEIYLYHHECVVILTFMRIYSKIVLKSPISEDIYKSWRNRVYRKLGIDKEKISFSYDKLNDTERDNLGEEMYKREEWLEAESVLKPSQSTKAVALLANIAFIQGKAKEAMKLHQKALKSKTVESLSTISEIATHLISLNKIHDAQNMLISSLESIQPITGNSLTFIWIKISIHIKLAHLSLIQAKNPAITKEEKERLRETFTSSIEQFLYHAKMHGVTAQHLYAYLEVYDSQVYYVAGKLLSDLTKDRLTKRTAKLLDLRRILGSCSSTCGDLFDLDSEVRGEAKGLYGIIDLRLGELGLMEEHLRRELTGRCVYENIVSKYLDELDRQIEDENRKTETGLEKAMRYIQMAESSVNPSYPAYGLIQTAMSLIQIYNGTPPQFPNMNSVFSIIFSNSLSKLQLSKLLISSTDQEMFSTIAYLQFSYVRQHFLKLFLDSSKPYHKDRLMLSLLLSNTIQKSIMPGPLSTESFLEGSSIWRNLNWHPTLEEMKERMAPNSAVLVLQYSQDLADVWAGFMCTDKEKNAKYWARSRKVDNIEQEKTLELLEKFKAMKNYLQKTPVNDEEAVEALIREGIRKLEEIISDVGSIGVWLEALQEIISPSMPVEPVEENPKKKAPPPPKGKAAEDKNVDAGLPLPSSGISTLYLCIDHRFINLPWETLPFLSVIPIISRDFSLITLDSRLATTSNFTKDTLKFAIERLQDPKTKEISDKLAQDFTTAKFEGIRQADPGQWEKLCSESSLFFNLISEGIEEQTVTSLSSSPCCRCIVNLERFIMLKKYMKKNKAREHPMPELFSMIGCASIVNNTWPILSKNAVEFAAGLWKGLTSNQSVGGAMFRYRNDAANILMKYGIVQYGIPYLRVQ